jgi:haloalkane dehalogenase
MDRGPPGLVGYRDVGATVWWPGEKGRMMEYAEHFVPLLYEQFAATPSTKPAFFALNNDLLGTVRSRAGAEPEMRAFGRPVRIIFGEADPSLNAGVARDFHEKFPGSELFLLPGARHFPQLDEPREVARLILSAPLARSSESASARTS